MINDYILNKPVIDTENLILREMTSKDINTLEQWLSDKEIYKYWGKKPSKSDLNPTLMFPDKPKKPTKSFHWGIAEKQNNKIIGEFWVYLIENNRMAKISYRLSRDYQGKGYMTQATKAVVEFIFKNTEIKRLWTDVDVRNIASYKVLEKNGFKREGCIRQGKMVSTYFDYYLYGLLKCDLE